MSIDHEDLTQLSKDILTLAAANGGILEKTAIGIQFKNLKNTDGGPLVCCSEEEFRMAAEAVQKGSVYQ